MAWVSWVGRPTRVVANSGAKRLDITDLELSCRECLCALLEGRGTQRGSNSLEGLSKGGRFELLKENQTGAHQADKGETWRKKEL